MVVPLTFLYELLQFGTSTFRVQLYYISTCLFWVIGESFYILCIQHSICNSQLIWPCNIILIIRFLAVSVLKCSSKEISSILFKDFLSERSFHKPLASLQTLEFTQMMVIDGRYCNMSFSMLLNFYSFLQTLLPLKVFSKLKEGRFPGEIELKDLITKKMTNSIRVNGVSELTSQCLWWRHILSCHKLCNWACHSTMK